MNPKLSTKTITSIIAIVVIVAIYLVVKFPDIKAASQKRQFYSKVKTAISNQHKKGGVISSKIDEENDEHYLMYYDEKGVYLKDFINPDIELIKVENEYYDCGYALRLDSLGHFYIESGYYSSKIKVSSENNYNSYGDDIVTVLKESANQQRWGAIHGYADQAVVVRVGIGVHYMASRHLNGKLYRLYSKGGDLNFDEGKYKMHEYALVDNSTGEIVEKESTYGLSIVVETSETMPEIFNMILATENSCYSETSYAEQKVELSSSPEVVEYFEKNWDTGMYTTANVGFDGAVLGRCAYSYISNVDKPSAIGGIYSEDMYFMFSQVREKLFENAELKLKDLLTNTTFGKWRINFAEDGFGEKLYTNPYCILKDSNATLKFYADKIIIESPYLEGSFFTSASLNGIKVKSERSGDSIILESSFWGNEHYQNTGRFYVKDRDDIKKLLEIILQGDLIISFDVTSSAFFVDSNSVYTTNITNHALNCRKSIERMIEIKETAEKIGK